MEGRKKGEEEKRIRAMKRKQERKRFLYPRLENQPLSFHFVLGDIVYS